MANLSSTVEDCVSETSECIILNNDETILPPKEFFDSQRAIVESLSCTKPRHLMSKQSMKEESKSPTVGIGSDDNMESSKLSTSNQSSSTISTLVKTSNVDVESSKISRISPHSTSKVLSKGLKEEFDLIHTKEQTQEIAPLALHQLRLERNISPPKLGIGYHKYLSCAIWVVSIITGKTIKIQ